jgi:hypothetical protein
VDVHDSSASLRPLGVGEILDRAVNLCVKFFVPLATIYLVYAVPLAIVAYYSSQGLEQIIKAFTEGVRGGHTPDINTILAAQNSAASPIWAIVAGVFALVVSPLPTAALIEATTAFYLGRKSSFAQAYRVGLDRYWNMLGVSLLFFFSALVVYVAVVLVTVFLVLGLSVLTAAAHTFGIVLSVVLVLAFGIAALLLALVLVLTLQIAYFACVVERASFTSAFTRSFKRTFARIGIGRSLLIGLIYVAIAFGIALVAGLGQAVVLALLHSRVVSTLYETILRIATAAFTTAFIGIFYLDLRVREEGLDLQLEAERLSAPAASPA